MKILITGGSSLLGKALLETAPGEHEVEATWYTNYVSEPMHQLNVTDQSQVRYTFDRVKPEVVIHCAGNGSVDYAEEYCEDVEHVNVGGTENILKSGEARGARLVYISTNAVFSGEEAPYAEGDRQEPVNVYGFTKSEAESRVRASQRWVIIRPHLLYGWPWPNGRKNWGMAAVELLSKGKSLRVVADRVTQPLYVGDCAEAIWGLIEMEEEVYHVAGEDEVSLYDFVRMVARVWGADEGLVSPCSSGEFPRIARRPMNTCYDLSKIYGLGLRPGGIEAGLRRMKEAQDK